MRSLPAQSSSDGLRTEAHTTWAEGLQSLLADPMLLCAVCKVKQLTHL